MLRTEIAAPANLRRIIARLAQTHDAVPGLVRQAVIGSGFSIQEHAREIVPTATGKLAASIQPTPLDGGMAVVVGSSLAYAPVQEFSENLQHWPPRVPRHEISRGINKGRLSAPVNTNPKATWGFLRKSLAYEVKPFREKLLAIVRRFKGAA